MDFRTTYLRGQVKENLDKLIEDIECLADANERLSKENQYLKSESYKDSELKIMNEKLERAYDDLYRGFPITEEEDKKARDWIEEHSAKHMNPYTGKRKYPGCGYSYRFTPTGLGVYGEVICSCGASYCFKELE